MNPTTKTYDIEHRSIAACILLTIITFGIYTIYWRVMQIRDINLLSDGKESTSPIVVILLSIITFGIYGVYWDAKAGKVIDKKTRTTNYLLAAVLLDIFALPYIKMCLFQSKINLYAN